MKACTTQEKKPRCKKTGTLRKIKVVRKYVWDQKFANRCAVGWLKDWATEGREWVGNNLRGKKKKRCLWLARRQMKRRAFYHPSLSWRKTSSEGKPLRDKKRKKETVGIAVLTWGVLIRTVKSQNNVLQHISRLSIFQFHIRL